MASFLSSVYRMARRGANVLAARTPENRRLFRVQVFWASHSSCVLGPSSSHHLMGFQEHVKVRSVEHVDQKAFGGRVSCPVWTVARDPSDACGRSQCQ